MQTFQVDKSGIIKVSRAENPRDLYEHQNQAIRALDKKNLSPFKGLLVLPTGGGKTLTAVHWLLKNFIDKKQKVLWIAHRHELLNQALDTVKNSAYNSLIKDIKEFRYRIISGHPKHDIPVNIKSTDDIIIASKDSLNSGLTYLLENWVKHSESILLVIDEAHHASAKTYRKLIESIEANFLARKKSNGFKMLGLTATPFRTEQGEAGLLKKVFPDDIIFAEHLRTLINRGILAEPIFESLETQLNFYHELSDKDIKSIEGFDKIPKDVAEKIAMSNIRNKQIVDHYIKNRERYKPLLLFAIDVDHAIALNALFKNRGVKSDFVVSSIQNIGTGAKISPQENSNKINQFKNGDLEVLIKSISDTTVLHINEINFNLSDVKINLLDIINKNFQDIETKIENNKNEREFIKFKLIQLNNSYVKDYYDFKLDAFNSISNLADLISNYFDDALRNNSYNFNFRE